MKMQGVILLNYNENTYQVENEEKSRFLRELLGQVFDNTDVSAQIQNIWDVDAPLSASQKVKLRGILTTYGIQIIDDNAGALQIYVENEKVAEWYKPTYKLKTDLAQLDPKKKLYLEMNIKYWSVFEEIIDS